MDVVLRSSLKIAPILGASFELCGETIASAGHIQDPVSNHGDAYWPPPPSRVKDQLCYMPCTATIFHAQLQDLLAFLLLSTIMVKTKNYELCVLRAIKETAVTAYQMMYRGPRIRHFNKHRMKDSIICICGVGHAQVSFLDTRLKAVYFLFR